MIRIGLDGYGPIPVGHGGYHKKLGGICASYHIIKKVNLVLC